MSKAITEDYVSFETAKLLKEKGFNEYVMRWYVIGGVAYDAEGDKRVILKLKKENIIELKNELNK